MWALDWKREMFLLSAVIFEVIYVPVALFFLFTRRNPRSN
jgi:hypothetical protein